MEKQENYIVTIEERTQKILESLDSCIKPSGLIDATKLATSFGFEVVEQKEIPDLYSGIITCDSNGKQMAINNNMSKESKRYSITYLLSAYLLYYQKQDFFTFKHLISNEDFEVSYMTRLLLIPESVIEKVYPNAIKDQNLLANIFQVPYNVMEQRLKEIKETKHQVLIKKLMTSKNK